MPTPPRFLALIADIVDSRRFLGPKRGALQHRLDQLVTQLNGRFADQLIAPFVVSRGDEFQGMLRGGDGLPDLIWALDTEFPPADIRLGIGFGTLETPLGDNVLQLDGPVLHRAREAIETAARSRRLGGVFLGFGEEGDEILNGIARLLERQRERMSDRQKKVLQYLRQGMTQVEIARKLRLTSQAISDHARAAGWDAYREGETALRRALQTFTATKAGGKKS
jgi:DNA-binding CsgD family transcriptional regulator